MNRKDLIEDLEIRASRLRKDSLIAMKEMGSGWLGGSFSSADIITALFFYRMKYDPKAPDWEERDRLVVSKAHACEIVYAALAEGGFFPKDELKTYSHLASRLQVHVDCKTPGIDCSGGSLGLGLSFAVGTAMAAYIVSEGKNLWADPRRKDPRYRVYCILGDGECNEGQVWEAVLNAAHYRLDNLTAIVDHNKFQSTGPVKEKMNTGSLAEKFGAFGWESREIDGNQMKDVVDALDWILTVSSRPQAIIAHTRKGCGFPGLEDTNCHMMNVTDECMQAGICALTD